MREVMERHSLAHADTLADSPSNIESAGVAHRPSDLVLCNNYKTTAEIGIPVTGRNRQNLPL